MSETSLPPGRHRADLPPDASARPVFVDWLARFVLRIFFRRIDIVDLERAPKDGPTIFVGNHINGLIDPALLIAFLPIKPRFLAKSTLWSQPVVRPFLKLAAAIPVYRRRDGSDPSKNAEMFRSCHEALAAGGAIALFPEGTSHNEPALIPLKTGVSRIVLEAERTFDGLGVQIVPVGLSFEEKERFRSRVLMHVGEPLDAAPELASYAEDPRQAVVSLTERIRQALAEVTLNFPSWDEGRLIARAAELYQRPAGELPKELDLKKRFAISQAFIDGYSKLKERFPERIQALEALVREYDTRLELYRLSDRQLASTYPPGRVTLFVLNSLVLLLVRLPMALIGTVLNLLPYRLVRWGSHRLGKEPDQIATYKLFGSLVFYPLTWILESGLAGWLAGHPAAAVTALVAPASAYLALRFHQRRDYFAREARAYLLLRSGKGSINALKALRQSILDELEELAELYQNQLESGSAETGSDTGSDRTGGTGGPSSETGTISAPIGGLQ